MGLDVLLTGTFHRTLDAKLRFAIPKSLREALGKSSERPVYLAPSSDGSLALFPETSFEQLAARLAPASPVALEVREYRRLFYARASRAEFDKQGRVRIPQELAELANLDHEIILLGVQDHVELWDQDVWETYLATRRARFDEIAEAAFSGMPIRETAEAIAATKEVERRPK